MMHLLLADKKVLPVFSHAHYIYKLEINTFGFCWKVQIYLEAKYKIVSHTTTICSPFFWGGRGGWMGKGFIFLVIVKE